MAIPKIIYQTFKSTNLPWLTKWHINCFLKKNLDYKYEFYDDDRIENFFKSEFDERTYKAYCKLNIGAAKADMFRYAILLKKGGIYLDIDSGINGKLSAFIRENDQAIITREKNHPNFFAQWALIYEPNHIFLKTTIDKIIENIEENKYPNDVHKMTGPTVYTLAVNECLQTVSQNNYRIFGFDYENHLQFKYKLGKFFLYKRGEHWKKKQLNTPVLKID
jgi:mannosyltransferase OCH1-like enzyme